MRVKPKEDQITQATYKQIYYCNRLYILFEMKGLKPSRDFCSVLIRYAVMMVALQHDKMIFRTNVL
jgi:hypothetical protein